MNKARAGEILRGHFKVATKNRLEGKGRFIKVRCMGGVIDPGFSEEEREAVMMWIADPSVVNR